MKLEIFNTRIRVETLEIECIHCDLHLEGTIEKQQIDILCCTLVLSAHG